MSIKSESFIEGLRALTDVDNDDYLESKLYDLCEQIEEDQDAPSVIPHIFAFLEAHPDADFGTPGPLVHFLEKQPRYKEQLMESVARKPMFTSILMINRILNSKLSSEERKSLIELLHSVETNPQADEEAREHANRFLIHQAHRK